MDAYGVHVFHIADGDCRIRSIPDDFVFHLVVALDAFLHQHLVDGGQGQGGFHHGLQLFFAVGKAAAGAAQSKGGPQDHGIADFLRRLHSLRNGIGDLRGNHRLSDFFAQLLEQFPVLRRLDAFHAGAQKLNFALPQNPLFGQLHGKIQARLAADAGNDGVRPLIAADTRQIFQRQGLHIDLVRNGGVRHNGCRVGVRQNHLVALLL